MRLYELLQSHVSSDPDMAIYAQLYGAQFTRDSKAVYDRKSKARDIWNQQIGYTLYGFSDVDYSPESWLEFFLPNDSVAKFLITIDQGFNYQELNQASYRKWQNEWQDILAHSPSRYQLGYSISLFPVGLSTLGYSLMAYVAFTEPKVYESTYLEWREKENPTQAHSDQRRRWRGMAIDGLLDFANRGIEAHKYYAFPVTLP
ncbi:MAG TPA: hypothetical protein IGS53_19860 [Leptolyngbyaceae cyanobacterium M33_DOE_097]|uniref:Uncharacterized protein n=1 Tax=Oscillatoriales cyanobacterium SpSt-418 TaxID=2282169 RepID=A0A7C3KCA3_9CYAN|nr:hypothetical protein [Leptolyngbyaceae cyanobacterium M33_DOE_097]